MSLFGDIAWHIEGKAREKIGVYYDIIRDGDTVIYGCKSDDCTAEFRYVTGDLGRRGHLHALIHHAIEHEKALHPNGDGRAIRNPPVITADSRYARAKWESG